MKEDNCIKCDRNKLKDILNITLNALKLIEKRKNLQYRLNKCGFELIDKYKEKNKYIYLIKKREYEVNKIIKTIYNTNKINEFIEYFNIRTIEEPSIIKEIALSIGVTEKTIIKWDNSLKEKEILVWEGFYYFRINRIDGEVEEISKEEYKSFWRNKAYLKAFTDLRIKYMKGEISLMQFKLTNNDIDNVLSIVENKHCFKVKKYKVNQNEIYHYTKRLINKH